MIRTFTGFILMVGVAGGLFAEDKAPTVGDSIMIAMTGDVAKAFLRFTNDSEEVEPLSDGVVIEIRATITKELDDGRYRIEHFSPIQENDKPPRLMSFSTIVDGSQLKPDVIPAKTLSYNSSNGNVTVIKVLKQEQKILRLELSELKGVKLRSWTLDEEVAK